MRQTIKMGIAELDQLSKFSLISSFVSLMKQTRNREIKSHTNHCQKAWENSMHAPRNESCLKSPLSPKHQVAEEAAHCISVWIIILTFQSTTAGRRVSNFDLSHQVWLCHSIVSNVLPPKRVPVLFLKDQISLYSKEASSEQWLVYLLREFLILLFSSTWTQNGFQSAFLQANKEERSPL